MTKRWDSVNVRVEGCRVGVGLVDGRVGGGVRIGGFGVGILD